MEEKMEEKKESKTTESAQTAEAPAAEAPKKKKKRSRRKALADGRIYVHASYNNIIVTVTDPRGDPALWVSAGSCGFKGTRKATPYAAQVTAEKAMEKAKLLGLERAHVYIKGVGIGRDQALRALAASGVEMQSITDLTSIPFGGCRPPKPRRV